jgi:hypothetical protein
MIKNTRGVFIYMAVIAITSRIQMHEGNANNAQGPSTKLGTGKAVLEQE